VSASARRAVGRWSVRLLRREWRSQVLVTVLIAASVGAAVFASTGAALLAPSRDAEMGTADHRIETQVERPAALDRYLAEARGWFGTIDVARHSSVAVPGASDQVELRAHETDGAYSGAMVAVRSGRRPEARGEVALTDDLASLLGADVGDEVELGGTSRLVVGLVEDPADLDDSFALVDPSALPDPQRVTLLVRADTDRAHAFRPTARPGPVFTEPRGQDEGTTAALGVLVVATIALLLVSLVAGAAFITVAQRRQRQLGLLAAVGATDRHLRSAMLAHGIAVGLVAGLAGTATGLIAWVAVAGALEGPAEHRIDRFAVPVGLVAAGPVLALVTATAAAWWPARAVARLPVVTALSGRPPAPRRAHRSIVAGGVLVLAGLAGIGAGIDPVADEVTPLLLVPGLVAAGASTLFLAGPALRGVARLAGRLPIGVRLPARDLARAEGRASAALGAVSLALGMAVAVVLLAAAAEPGVDRGNLAPDQLAVWAAPPEAGRLQVPAIDDAEVGSLDAAADRIAAAVGEDGGDDPTVVPLDLAVAAAPAGRSDGVVQVGVAVLARPVGPDTLRDAGRIYVATPELLRHLGIDQGAIPADTLLLTAQRGAVHITGDVGDSPYRGRPVPAGQAQRIDGPDHSSAPRTLITEAGLAAAGLSSQRAGWLVEATGPIDGDAVGRARAVAADEGLSVEGRDQSTGLRTLRTVATGIGAGLALGIVALTLGLVRSEGARDARTLAAIGASGRTRRQVQASTAGLLAGIGAVLGASIAAAAVVAGYWGQTGRLSHVPVAHLAALVLGLPALAVATSWLAAGDPSRRPRAAG